MSSKKENEETSGSSQTDEYFFLVVGKDGNVIISNEVDFNESNVLGVVNRDVLKNKQGYVFLCGTGKDITLQGNIYHKYDRYITEGQICGSIWLE